MTTEALYALFKSCTGVSTDTRKISPGVIYFALKGPRFNGNLYALEALEKGARYAVVDNYNISRKAAEVYFVEDVLDALQKLANYHRTLLKTTLIAITGSNGKTTTKGLFKQVLHNCYNVQATEGNLNNHIGVPLTLLKLKAETQIGIVEMGANHIGEIQKLCEIADPDWGYITNFGKAHLEGFGSEAGVIKGKTELYRYLLKKKGSLIVNADDPIQVELSASATAVSFGKMESNHYSFQVLPSKTDAIALEFSGRKFTSSLYGDYNIPNLAAAITIGKIFKIADAAIQEGLNGFQPENNRSQVLTRDAVKIILDAYNANPSSMRAALHAFHRRKEKRKAVILGDMLELGSYAKAEHQNLIDTCVTYGFSKIILVGPCFGITHHGDKSVLKFETTASLKIYLDSHPLEVDCVLIKGSRGMALEKLIPEL